MIFEDHSTHGPDDPMATVTTVVHCHPGQVEAIKDFLSGVTKQAGVYAVELEHKIVEETKALIGHDDGEQLLQPANSDDQAADLGTGCIPAEGGAAEIVSERDGAEMAGAAGKDPAEPEQRDSVGEDLRASDGLGGRD